MKLPYLNRVKIRFEILNCGSCQHSDNKDLLMAQIKSDLLWLTTNFASRKLLRMKVTPDLHLTYSKNGGNLGLVLKMKNIACISILLTKHVKFLYICLNLFNTVL